MSNRQPILQGDIRSVIQACQRDPKSPFQGMYKSLNSFVTAILVSLLLFLSYVNLLDEWNGSMTS